MSLPPRRRWCVTTWSGAIPSAKRKWPRCCAYREVEMHRAVPGGAAQEPAVAVIAYDEKPGI
jgi:hypothetical protein